MKVIPLRKENNVIEVDFKNRAVLNPKIVVKSNLITLEDPMKYFKPLDLKSNFGKFSSEQRLDYSNFVIKNIKQMGFSDLLHFIDVGVLDQKKTAAALGIPFNVDENGNGDEAS